MVRIDLAGTFKAYLTHIKGATTKTWLAGFCCSTTSTINIKVIHTYDSDSLILAFTQKYVNASMNELELQVPRSATSRLVTR